MPIREVPEVLRGATDQFIVGLAVSVEGAGLAFEHREHALDALMFAP
jgi:hypothetical protein